MTPSVSFSQAVAQCTEKTQTVLTQAGWTPTYYYDLAHTGQQLAAAGHALLPAAYAFLNAVGGLHLKFTIHHAGTNRDLSDDIHFDPLGAVRSVDPGWFQYYTSILQTPLTPIGSADNRHYVLLMDEQGQVFGAYGEFILFYGKTGVQMIDHLVMQRVPAIIRGDMVNNPRTRHLPPPVAAVATHRQDGTKYEGVRGIPDAKAERQLLQQYGRPPKHPVPYTCCAEAHVCYLAAQGQHLDALDLFTWEVHSGLPRPRCTNCQVAVNVRGMQLWSEPHPPIQPS